jgi:hypothetical protein
MKDGSEQSTLLFRPHRGRQETCQCSLRITSYTTALFSGAILKVASESTVVPFRGPPWRMVQRQLVPFPDGRMAQSKACRCSRSIMEGRRHVSAASVPFSTPRRSFPVVILKEASESTEVPFRGPPCRVLQTLRVSFLDGRMAQSKARRCSGSIGEGKRHVTAASGSVFTPRRSFPGATLTVASETPEVPFRCPP